MLFGRILVTNGCFVFQLIAWCCIAGKIVDVFFPNRNSGLSFSLLQYIVTVIVFVLLVSTNFKTGMLKIPGFDADLQEAKDQCDILVQIVVKIKDHLAELDDLYTKIENHFALLEHHFDESENKDLSEITITKIENLSMIFKYYENNIIELFQVIEYHITEIKDLLKMGQHHSTIICDILTVAGIDFIIFEAQRLIRMLVVVEERDLETIVKRQFKLAKRTEILGSLFAEYVKQLKQQVNDTEKKRKCNQCEK